MVYLGLTGRCVREIPAFEGTAWLGVTSVDSECKGGGMMWKPSISPTTDSLSASSFQCNVCGQRANNFALCVCGQRALVPMVVCY